MSSQPNESTGEPIRVAAATVGTAITAVISILGAAVGLGLLSSDQADALTALGNQVITALPELSALVIAITGLVSGLGASFATAWAARKKTVPVDSDAFDVVKVAPGPLDH